MVKLLLSYWKMKSFSEHGRTRSKNRESQKRTIRRSRRLFAKGKRDRLSVGQILGLTPGLVRKKTHTVEEAAAEQLAEIAAAKHDEERSMRKGKRTNASSEAQKLQKAKKSQNLRTSEMSENKAGARSASEKEKVGSERLSFWGKDHAVTPRKSLVNMFKTTSEDEPSVDAEPNTSDIEFIKDSSGEDSSDPNYQMTNSEEEELSPLGKAPKAVKGRRANITPLRKKAMGADPRYTPEYYESKDNEEKGPEMRRQPTPIPEVDSPGATSRRRPTRKSKVGVPKEKVDPEEVVEEGGDEKPPPLTDGSSGDDEEDPGDHSEDPEEYTSGDQMDEGNGAPAGAGGPPDDDDDPSSDGASDPTRESDSSGSSEEYLCDRWS